ncbi:TetR/AcrR family transcriptional regulator [Nonomuraea jiangxiensis]|uniref:DNA-binding transcriptional regulator, AcrR family n=1 Tax=Nonomuraea jiangxiensis TaxID=633440 RepID=A0A1G8FNX7_9ACTN|nr:TetR/AcrR family transcriptional regulator [Nonomuraea jiangxiensis]SDH83791.1 DNA-binding transcriptional regulator, AcrR family [Nonomuraea jiangxiensis]
MVVLSKNSGASLTEIAAAAGVGRTTIHRYFPERSDLLTGIGNHLLEQIELATERARLDEGTAAEALERVCQEYFELGDALRFAYDNPQISSWVDWETETAADRALTRLVERGHADGTLDPEQPVAWVAEVLWAMLYAAWQHVHANAASKHTSLNLCLHSLRRAVMTDSHPRTP